MLVILSNDNGSSPCIYHIEDNFYQQYPYMAIIEGLVSALYMLSFKFINLV